MPKRWLLREDGVGEGGEKSGKDPALRFFRFIHGKIALFPGLVGCTNEMSCLYVSFPTAGWRIGALGTTGPLPIELGTSQNDQQGMRFW